MESTQQKIAEELKKIENESSSYRNLYILRKFLYYREVCEDIEQRELWTQILQCYISGQQNGGKRLKPSDFEKECKRVIGQCSMSTQVCIIPYYVIKHEDVTSYMTMLTEMCKTVTGKDWSAVTFYDDKTKILRAIVWSKYLQERLLYK